MNTTRTYIRVELSQTLAQNRRQNSSGPPSLLTSDTILVRRHPVNSINLTCGKLIINQTAVTKAVTRQCVKL